MANNANRSLQKIAKGAGIAFFGTVISLFLAFIGRILVARIGTEAEYGIFSLSLVILNICAIVATMGLEQGSTRSIAYERGKNNFRKVQDLVSASITFGLLASISLSFIIFFVSDTIATAVFHDTALAFPLKVFALGIPFFAMIHVFVSLFRGFDDVKPRVYFQQIMRTAVFPLLLFPIVFFGLPFYGVFYAFLISLVVSFVAIIVYAVKELPVKVKVAFSLNNKVAKELMLFSLPLLGVATLQLIIGSTDTLMLGALKTSTDVGLYNAAFPLARFISSPLEALLVIYTPIVSGLYAKGLMDELKKNFSVITKWLCSATLPLFLVLFLFPEVVLKLFGAKYIFAADTLRILSLGFIISNFMGPNDATLIAVGEARFIMWATLTTAILNVMLNFGLIPLWGIVGASVASVVSKTSINLILCWKVYSISKAQPFSKNLMKPTAVSIIIIFLIYFAFGSHITSLWILSVLFILYYAIYGLAVLFTKSFDQGDIEMLLAMEKRAGVKVTPVKRVLKKFL